MMLRVVVGVLLLFHGAVEGRRLLQCEDTETEAASVVDGAISKAFGDLFSLALSKITTCENIDLFGPGEKELSAAFAISINNVADDLEACGVENPEERATAIVNDAAVKKFNEFGQQASEEKPEQEDAFAARSGFLAGELSEDNFASRSLFETPEDKAQRTAETIVKGIEDILGLICGTKKPEGDGDDCKFDGEKFIGGGCIGRKESKTKCVFRAGRWLGKGCNNRGL